MDPLLSALSAVPEQRAGRSRRHKSKLRRWMEAHTSEMRRQMAGDNFSWRSFATVADRQGFRQYNGLPLTVECCRSAWYRTVHARQGELPVTAVEREPPQAASESNFSGRQSSLAPASLGRTASQDRKFAFGPASLPVSGKTS